MPPSDRRHVPPSVHRDPQRHRDYSEILPGLFQGGTPDADWHPAAAPHGLPLPSRVRLEDRFDAVVTLFAYARPCDWGVAELRYGFADADPAGADMAAAIGAARWAHVRWRAGDRVLIRCQAGLNRSGLITALVLMLDGRPPHEAIALIRRRRSPDALFNRGFVRWLTQEAPAALNGGGRPSAPRAGSRQLAARRTRGVHRQGTACAAHECVENTRVTAEEGA